MPSRCGAHAGWLAGWRWRCLGQRWILNRTCPLVPCRRLPTDPQHGQGVRQAAARQQGSPGPQHRRCRGQPVHRGARPRGGREGGRRRTCRSLYCVCYARERGRYGCAGGGWCVVWRCACGGSEGGCARLAGEGCAAWGRAHAPARPAPHDPLCLYRTVSLCVPHPVPQLLYDTFSAFGVIVNNPKIMRDPDTGLTKGFGFLSFDSFEASGEPAAPPRHPRGPSSCRPCRAGSDARP